MPVQRFMLWLTSAISCFSSCSLNVSCRSAFVRPCPIDSSPRCLMTTLLPAGVKVYLAFGYIDMRDRPSRLHWAGPPCDSSRGCNSPAGSAGGDQDALQCSYDAATLPFRCRRRLEAV